jgi:hypothetical protein
LTAVTGWADLLAAGPAEDQATLTLAIGVALPSIGRLHDVTNPARGQTATS